MASTKRLKAAGPVQKAIPISQGCTSGCILTPGCAISLTRLLRCPNLLDGLLIGGDDDELDDGEIEDGNITPPAAIPGPTPTPAATPIPEPLTPPIDPLKPPIPDPLKPPIGPMPPIPPRGPVGFPSAFPSTDPIGPAPGVCPDAIAAASPLTLLGVPGVAKLPLLLLVVDDPDDEFELLEELELKDDPNDADETVDAVALMGVTAPMMFIV
ncbi:hypothetical protein HK101_007622 [Irineochytrium annulatum]|nr:hypothetical protein HK101_007622 [Irineochytrium annulatum]